MKKNMTTVNDENKNDLYAKLVKYTESSERLTRFKMLYVLEELGIELNKESIDLIEKLYADGFIDA